MKIEIEEVRIPVRDAVLAGTLLKPAGGRHPCLLLISGSGAHDRDETVCGHTPLRVVAEYFASQGYAVLRCDDRGVAASTGDADKQDFDGAIADANACYMWLVDHPGVDRNRIALVGHSEGGLIAAAAGSKVNVWAVVMLAGPAVPIEGLLHEQAKIVSVEGGATVPQIDHERRMNEQVFALARSDLSQSDVLREIKCVIRASLRTWPDTPAFDECAVDDSARIMSGVVGAPAYRSLLRQDPVSIIGGFKRPLLGIYGGKDTQVPGGANSDAFRAITVGRPRAAVMFFPDHNHLFQVAETGAIAEYQKLPPGPDIAVLRAVASWLAKVEPEVGLGRNGV